MAFNELLPVLDIAVMDYEQQSPLTLMNMHQVNLDTININWSKFTEIFYPLGFFSISDKNKNNEKYISLMKNYRTVNGTPFSLLNQLLSDASQDLQVSLNNFTKSSLIELTKEILGITSLDDFGNNTITSSLTKQDIINTLRHNINTSEQLVLPSTNAILCISLIFRSLNADIKPTSIKLSYNVSFTNSFN